MLIFIIIPHFIPTACLVVIGLWITISIVLFWIDDTDYVCLPSLDGSDINALVVS